jgi:flagellar biosynthetic protein FliR
LVPVVLLGSGLYSLPVMALVGSYHLFPPGHAIAPADLARSVVLTTSRSFLFAMELAAPFILLGTLWQVALALLSRFVPTLQIYGLAMPAQIFGGLLLLACFIQGMILAWSRGMGLFLRALPGV